LVDYENFYCDKFETDFGASLNIWRETPVRESKDSNHQYLVKFRDKLKNNSDKHYEKILVDQLDSLAISIGQFKSRQESFKKLAPNLSTKLEAFVKFKIHQKGIERDFD
jgi:hypothetical protein